MVSEKNLNILFMKSHAFIMTNLSTLDILYLMKKMDNISNKAEKTYLFGGIRYLESNLQIFINNY